MSNGGAAGSACWVERGHVFFGNKVQAFWQSWRSCPDIRTVVKLQGHAGCVVSSQAVSVLVAWVPGPRH